MTPNVKFTLEIRAYEGDILTIECLDESPERNQRTSKIAITDEEAVLVRNFLNKIYPPETED